MLKLTAHWLARDQSVELPRERRDDVRVLRGDVHVLDGVKVRAIIAAVVVQLHARVRLVEGQSSVVGPD